MPKFFPVDLKEDTLNRDSFTSVNISRRENEGAGMFIGPLEMFLSKFEFDNSASVS